MEQRVLGEEGGVFGVWRGEGGEGVRVGRRDGEELEAEEVVEGGVGGAGGGVREPGKLAGREVCIEKCYWRCSRQRNVHLDIVERERERERKGGAKHEAISFTLWNMQHNPSFGD